MPHAVPSSSCGTAADQATPLDGGVATPDARPFVARECVLEALVSNDAATTDGLRTHRVAAQRREEQIGLDAGAVRQLLPGFGDDVGHERIVHEGCDRDSCAGEFDQPVRLQDGPWL